MRPRVEPRRARSRRRRRPPARRPGRRSPNAIRISFAPPSESSTSRTRPARSRGVKSSSAIDGAPPRSGDRPELDLLTQVDGNTMAAVIARYTRPELGALWTDEARMTAWRDVEVAAAEALDGPTEADLEAIRGATFTVEAVKEREAVTDHDVAAFVDVLAASAGPAGRWIHFGLTSSDVLDTALALQLRRAGEPIVRRRPRAGGRAGRAGARARGHAVRRPHARRARRADLVRPQARGLRARGAPQRRAAGARVRAGGHRRDLGRRRHLRVARPGLRGAACSSGSGWPAEPVSTQVVPRDRHAELLSAIALAGAGLERFATRRSATSSAPRCARSRSRSGPARRARARCRTSATRSRPSASAASRACCAATRRPGWRTSRSGTSATSRTPAPSGSCCPTRRSCSTTCSTSPCGSRAGWSCTPTGWRANLEITSGALFSQRVLLALVEQGMQRDDAYRIVQRLAQQAWDTRHAAARRCSSRSRRRARSRRRLRLRALHPPRAGGAANAGGDPDA